MTRGARSIPSVDIADFSGIFPPVGPPLEVGPTFPFRGTPLGNSGLLRARKPLFRRSNMGPGVGFPKPSGGECNDNVMVKAPIRHQWF